jgi:hypothetical protein
MTSQRSTKMQAIPELPLPRRIESLSREIAEMRAIETDLKRKLLILESSTMLSMYEMERGYKNEKQREAACTLTLDQNEYYVECLEQLRENLKGRRLKEALLERLRSEHQLDLLSRKDIIATKRLEGAYHPEIRWQDAYPPNVNVPIPPDQSVPEWIDEQQKMLDQKWNVHPRGGLHIRPEPLKIKEPPEPDHEAPAKSLEALAGQLRASIEREKKKEDDKFQAPF